LAGGQERILRRRIRSVQSTKKITRAMELIAASRIVKAQQRVHAAVPYSDKITEVVRGWVASGRTEGSRAAVLRELSHVEGVYVPSMYDVQYSGADLVSITPKHADVPALVEKRTIAEVKQWLASPLKESYMEVSLVGDLDVEKTLAAVAKTLHIETANRHHDVIVNDVFEATVEDKLAGPVFVYDYPTSMCPLTKRKKSDPSIAARFQIFREG